MAEKSSAISKSLTRKQADEIVAKSRHDLAMMSGERRKQALEIARANLAEMTEEEDRAITENALADSDNPPLDDEFFARRGRPVLQNPKERVTIRLDADLVSRLRAGGSGWQTRANAILRKAVGLK